MDARLFRRVQRYGWDAATVAYHRDWVPLLQSLTHAAVKRAALRPGERVLDLATGTGVAAFAAAKAVGPTGAVLGIDISEQMVARAIELAGGAITRGHLRFERHDMEDTGAADAAFDAVVAAFGLMYAAQPTAAFAEIARVLAPQGRVSLCVWGRRSACRWADVFPIVDAEVASQVCPLFFALGAPGALSLMLTRAGFIDVVEERRPVTLTWHTANEACSAMLEGGPVALAWKRFAPEVRARVRAAYLGSIEACRHGDRYDVPSEIVFAHARKA